MSSFCKHLEFFRYKGECLKSFYVKPIIFGTSEIFLESTLLKICLAVFSSIAPYREHLLLVLWCVFLIGCTARLNGLLWTCQSLLYSPVISYKYGPPNYFLLNWHLSQSFRRFFQVILSPRSLLLHVNITKYGSWTQSFQQGYFHWDRYIFNLIQFFFEVLKDCRIFILGNCCGDGRCTVSQSS